MNKKVFLITVMLLIVSCTAKTEIIDENKNTEWIQGNVENADYYLLHFFNVHCTTCVEQSQELKEISEKIPNVQVIGVSVPEFEFQKKNVTIKEELGKNNINYAVISDINHTIRIAYDQKRVPSFILLDKKGKVVENTNNLANVKEQLSKIYSNKEFTLKPKRHIISEKTTPRLYGGYNYATTYYGNIEKEQLETWQNYTLPDAIEDNKIYVQGEWFANQDRLNLISVHPGLMVVKFHGTKVDMLARSRKPQNVTVYIDNSPIPRQNAGKDIFYNENDESYFVANSTAAIHDIANYGEEEGRAIVLYPSATRFNLFWIEFS